MDLQSALIIGISTLALVISVMWLALRAVEKRFGRKLAESEANCREELALERAEREKEKKRHDEKREKDQERLRDIEYDVRKLLTDEVVKNQRALTYVGSKLGVVVERIDEVAGRLGLAPRKVDPNAITEVVLQALTGAGL